MNIQHNNRIAQQFHSILSTIKKPVARAKVAQALLAYLELNKISDISLTNEAKLIMARSCDYTAQYWLERGETKDRLATISTIYGGTL